MTYFVQITNHAENDIRHLVEYIAYERQSLTNASKQLNRIEQVIMNLSEMPDRFRLYDREPWRSRGLRVAVVNQYCIFYIVNKEEMIVSIIRVMHSRQDMDTQLLKYT